MPNAVLAPSKLSLVLKHELLFGLLMQTDSIAGDLLQANTSDSAYLCAEIAAQQVLTQTDALENLSSTIRADGRYSHLRHNLLQTFIYRLDVMSFSRRILLLNLAALHQIVEDSEGHIRTQGTCTIAQQQGSMHHLANLTALHDESSLYSLAHADEIVVDSRDSQQTRNSSVRLVKVAIAQNDVVHSFIDTLLCLLAEIFESLAKSALPLCYFKENGQLLRLESLVADVT